jgi:hypothetical protein
MNGIQWKFMAGAPKPVNQEAHPRPINAITGNVHKKMDAWHCFL